MDLKDLYKNKDIDSFTMYVCKQNNLIDLESILDYQKNNGSFLGLDYCSKEDDQKLRLLCFKYHSHSTTSEQIKNPQSDESLEEKKHIPNYNLEQLAEIEDLGIRSQNACKYFNLDTLRDIIYYFKKNGDFLKVRNCGRKSNDELIKLCEKYQNFEFSDLNERDDFDNKSIDEILQQPLSQLVISEKLSVRVQNVCQGNELKNLNLILDYYNKHGDFKKLRNCGSNSNSELVELCKKYLKFTIQPNSSNSQKEELINPINTKIKELTTKQKAVLNNIIYSKYNQLTVRSKHALSHLLENSITIRAIRKEFLGTENYDYKKIKNVGELTEIEIKEFIVEVKDLVELISLFGDNEILKEYYSSYLIKNYQVSHETINQIGRNYDFSLGYPIFKTLYHLIDGGYLFDEKEKEVFFGLLNFFQDSKPPLIKDFKSDLKLSRERFRQIRNKTLKKIPNTINLLFNLELNLENLNTYQLSPNDEFINISGDDVGEINRIENVNFNSPFIVYIFSILHKESHDIIGNSENIFFNKSSNNQHNWENLYLVRKDLTWIFDFNKFVQDIYKRLSSKIQEDYKFHFQSYLLNFQNENCLSKLDTITTICETIIFSEFEMSVDLEENITFKRNTLKQVHEYSYEALEQLGEPSKVQKIYEKVKELYPDFNTNPSKIRASMKQNNGFVPFGRTSVFGLKIWEEEQDIRGGTIRDISEEFLLMQNEPKHIDEITEYVNRYRDTNAKNIYANLKMEENNRFVFFSGLLIGLKSKTYIKTNYTKVEDKQIIRKTWEESFQLLEEFTQKNNRLPFSTGGELEERLYRFLNVQFNRASKGKVGESKLRKLTQLCEKFGFKKGKRRNSKSTDESYMELKKFLLKERRLPSAINEAKLYRFLYTQGKLFRDDSLSKEYHDKYLEVKNLIKEIL